MAMGSVCVSPGMFETKVMVAPNSPSARAKPSTVAAMMPGSASGSVTLENASQRDAPSVRAATSSRRSTASIDSRIAPTISGSAMMAAAIAAPVQRNMTLTPNQLSSQLPTGPCRPNASSNR